MGDVYIIPHNYKDNGKILGFIEKESLITALIWFVPMAFLDFWFLPLDATWKIILLILVVVPPTIFALAGIGNETLISFAKFVYRFYKNSKLYLYDR